jgi:hypothetical protein
MGPCRSSAQLTCRQPRVRCLKESDGAVQSEERQRCSTQHPLASFVTSPH